MAGFKGRNSVACRACHAQKLKCNGGVPCQRCGLRGRECVYPTTEKFITVPENYVRELERQANLARQATTELSVLSRTAGSGTGAAGAPPQSGSHPVMKHQLLEGCSAEGFVQKLKELSSTTISDDAYIRDSAQASEAGPESEGYYTYSRLKFDFLQPEVSFRLPPRPYAFDLLQAFEEGFCDYHWYMRRQFRERLSLTYSDPTSQSGDRNWLCRVSVVLALAETWMQGRKSSSGESMASNALGSSSGPPLPPGSDFFEQGLLLLKTSSEEPVPEDVEAYNLIAFYCYSLNRRKTAYSYASQSIALARLLHLDKPRPARSSVATTTTGAAAVRSGTGTNTGSGANAAEHRAQNEHRRRLWWTSYCMDRMVSTELGLDPTQPSVPEWVSLPSSAGLLTDEERSEFSDPRLLAAQAQLCEIKRCVVDGATRGLRTADEAADDDDDGGGGGERRRLEALRPCLEMLQAWRDGLGPRMMYTFEEGIPAEMMELPFARVLASLYLRYHQCFILLLRPLYLQELSLVIQKRGLDTRAQPDYGSLAPLLSEGANEMVTSMKLECLRAARNNCKILFDLCRTGKIAKFGYWDSSHLFSGLAILSLAQVTIPPGSDLASTGSSGSDDDAILYARARSLLEEMARMGNPSSKDHEALLSDVEAMVKRVSAEMVRSRQGQGQAHAGEAGSWGDEQSSAGIVDFGLGEFEGIMGDQLWCDMDWENLLSTYTQGI